MHRSDPKASAVDIVVVGSANVDLVVEVPHLPRAGETVLARRLSVYEGGKGANQAVAAARAGGRVSLIGSIGRDAHGERLRSSLIEAGISTECLNSSDHPTGTALIHVDDLGQNSIAVVPGANSRLAPEHVQSAGAAFPLAKTYLLQMEIPIETVTAAARQGAARRLRVILNPAPATQVTPALLELVHRWTSGAT